MNDNEEQKLNLLITTLSDKWVAYCEAKEDLRQFFGSVAMPEEEVWFKDISISIEVSTYNRHEELRNFDIEKNIMGHRDLKLDIKAIDQATNFLHKLKAKYANKNPNMAVKKILDQEKLELKLNRKIIIEKEAKGIKCQCNDPGCGKCLLGNCQDDNCPMHTKKQKEAQRLNKKI